MESWSICVIQYIFYLSRIELMDKINTTTSKAILVVYTL